MSRPCGKGNNKLPRAASARDSPQVAMGMALINFLIVTPHSNPKLSRIGITSPSKSPTGTILQQLPRPVKQNLFPRKYYTPADLSPVFDNLHLTF